MSLETPTGFSTALNMSFIEPPGNVNTWSPPPLNDYMIMVLDQAIAPNGVGDQFYNKVYAGSDASLANQNVLCMGYGATFEATPNAAAGGYMLTSANMPIASPVTGGVYTRNRTNNIVGFGGDSGSTCFLNGLITGVQSTCGGGSYYDLNANGKDDFWGENYNVQSCSSVTAGTFRSFVANNILTSVNVQYDGVPPFVAGTTVAAVVTTPAGVTNISNVLSPTSISTPRSGRFETEVVQPPTMMCPKLTSQGPMEGTLALNGTCLDQGLVSILVN